MKRAMKHLVTVLGFASVAGTATLAMGLPRTTLADPADNLYGQQVAEGTKFGTVVVNGELVKDAHAKTGWLMVITAENKGDAPQSYELETDLTRQFVNPMGRVGDLATELLKADENITVAAHAKQVITREVPAWIAAQLESTAKVDRARRKARAEVDARGWDAAPPLTRTVAMAPFNVFAVAFPKAHA